jgi:hypothetical protein
MEQFEIQLLDVTYTIEPQDNGTFRILEGEEKVGVVYPESGALGIEWKTMDELEEGFVSQIGELISEHEMDKSKL